MVAPTISGATSVLDVSLGSATIQHNLDDTPTVGYNAPQDYLSINNIDASSSTDRYFEIELSSAIDLSDKQIVFAFSRNVGLGNYARIGLRSGATPNTNTHTFAINTNSNTGLEVQVVIDGSTDADNTIGTFDPTDVRAIRYEFNHSSNTVNRTFRLFSDPYTIPKAIGLLGLNGEVANELKLQTFADFLIRDYYALPIANLAVEGFDDFWQIPVSLTFGDGSTAGILSLTGAALGFSSLNVSGDSSAGITQVGPRTIGFNTQAPETIQGITFVSTNNDNFAENSSVSNDYSQFFLENFGSISLNNSDYVATFLNPTATVTGGRNVASRFSGSTAAITYEWNGTADLSGSTFNSPSSDHYIDIPSSIANGSEFDATAITFSVNPGISKFRTNVPSGETITILSTAGITLSDVTELGLGTTVVSAPVVSVTIPTLVAGSNLKIYDVFTDPSTAVLVDGVDSSGSSFVWTTGIAGNQYSIHIVNPGFEDIRIASFEYPSSSASLPIEQVVDINYLSTASAYDLTLTGAGLGTTTDIWLDGSGSALEIGMATGNNLSQPSGIPFQLLYSFIIESRHTNNLLMRFHTPIVCINAVSGQFELRRGTIFKDATTRDLLRSGGFNQYSTADALEATWLDASGLLSLASSGTIYYWFGSATNPTIVNTLNAGFLNDLIQVFGDVSNGNFDFRSGTELTFSIREQGENISTYRLFADQLTPQGITELRAQAYSIPLTTTANANITIADVAIDSNSDGTADVAPFDGMSLTTLESASVADWTNAAVYGAFAQVESNTVPGDFYITVAGGTSSGTNPVDDVGVVWYQIDAVYDANNGDLPQMTAYLFWLQRQNIDIDDSSINQTGRSVMSLATTRGSTLVLRPGLWAINFNTSAQLTHIPVETDGTERPYPPPPVAFNGPNVADGAPYQVIHRQIFNVSASDVSTGGNTITLTTDTNGDAPLFDTTTAGRHTLVRFNLADGATIPTTSPQIQNTGSYRVLSESSGVIQIEVTESGGAVTFSTQGVDNGSSQLGTLVFETLAVEGTVSGGSGITETLSLPNSALYRFKTIHQDTTGGPRKTTRFVDVVGSWNSTSGASFIDVVDATNTASDLWTEVNRIADLTNYELEDVVVDNAGNAITSVDPVQDGADIGGITFLLEGRGFIQINAGALTKNAVTLNGTISGQDLVMWAAYQLGQLNSMWLASSTTVIVDGLSNAIIDNLEFEETTGNLFQQYGMNIRERDGYPLVSPNTTGPVVLNLATRGNAAVIETGTSGLTAGEAQTIVDIKAKTDQLTFTVANQVDANALTGGGGGDATEANQTTIINTLSAIQGSGYTESTDSLEAIRDRGDTAWITATGFAVAGDIPAADITAILSDTNELQTDWADGGRLDVILDSRASQISVDDIPNTAEFEARTLPTTSYFDSSSDQVTVATNNDKTGYSLTQAFPANFAILAIDGSGQVTAGAMGGTVTVGGYAAGQSPAEQIDISNLALENTAQSCLSAARAVADGRFVADYTNSTATQYNQDGTSRTVFDLLQADGSTAATSAQDAVERRPQ